MVNLEHLLKNASDAEILDQVLTLLSSGLGGRVDTALNLLEDQALEDDSFLPEEQREVLAIVDIITSLCVQRGIIKQEQK